MKYLIELSYIGTDFAGFQVQPGKRTVQSAIQDALEKIYGERYPVKGCSRTDSGVHARSYFAVYESDKAIPEEKIPIALNTALDDDISVLSARSVPDSFHVRHDVLFKEYEYLIENTEIRNPFSVGRVCRLSHTLDSLSVERMKKAAVHFVGQHDFAAFMSAGASVSDTVRCIKYLTVNEEKGLISIKVAADGFLYNMVRIIVGTLVDCARGRIEPDDIKKIISGRDRSKAGFTVPPQGLYLSRVIYTDFGK